MKVIKNGSVLVNDTLQNVDVLIDNGKIVNIAPNIEGNYEVIDASGLTVLPGLVDVHVHLREPGHCEKETIATGTKAAAAGGFTSIFAMPNVIPFPDNKETMESYLQLIHEKSIVNTYPYGCITQQEAGKLVVDMPALKKLGINWYSDDGVGVANSEVMEKAMLLARKENVMIVAHTEDMQYRRPGACVHQSKVTADKGWLGIPSECEFVQLKRDLEMAHRIGNKYHACHISAKESVNAIAHFKELGANVSGEVTAHHLLLEDKDVQGPNWKMNPPLRSHEDRMALIEGLESGALDMIANDHAPHSKQDKEKSMDKAAFGIVSLETSFALLYSEFVVKQHRWSLAQLINWMAKAPAKRFGLESKGEIKVGYDADIILVDTNNEYTIDANTFESMGRNTPFDGWCVHCKVKQTLVSGNTVWKG